MSCPGYSKTLRNSTVLTNHSFFNGFLSVRKSKQLAYEQALHTGDIVRSRARATRDSRVCRLQLGNKMMLFFSFLKGDRGGPGPMGQSGPEGGPVRLAYSRRSDSGDGAEKKQEGVGGRGG